MQVEAEGWKRVRVVFLENMLMQLRHVERNTLQEKRKFSTTIQFLFKIASSVNGKIVQKVPNTSQFPKPGQLKSSIVLSIDKDCSASCLLPDCTYLTSPLDFCHSW